MKTMKSITDIETWVYGTWFDVGNQQFNLYNAMRNVWGQKWHSRIHQMWNSWLFCFTFIMCHESLPQGQTMTSWDFLEESEISGETWVV